MKRIGRIGKINIKANKILKQKYTERGTKSCEIRLPGCMPNFALSFAHKHKRLWYYSRPELLSSIKETLIACPNCHDEIEDNKKLTEEVFKKLRNN